MQLLLTLNDLYHRLMGCLSHIGDKWLIGLAARFTFASVLFFYYINSAGLKIGDGIFGFLSIGPGGYYQIIPHVMEAHGGDPSAIPFFYHIVVYMGTYAEFILPLLIVIGLFTRLAALAMIGFIFVQSIVDILYHNADAITIGNMFDRVQDSAILDQRMLWVFLLLILVIKGAGAISLDRILVKNR